MGSTIGSGLDPCYAFSHVGNERKEWTMKKISRIYLGLIFLLLYLPIFYLIAYAFNAGGDMNAFTGFTLEHFQSLFEDTRLMLILSQTFLLAFLSALIATIIGTFGAIYNLPV